MATSGETVLRDVLNIKEDMHAGDFKIDLSVGFTESAQRVDEYVVTPQLRKEFEKALGLVRSAVKNGASHAAYLHGSFGAGKSHFLTVLHAVLNGDPAARSKARLQEIVADNDDWLRGKRFLMVPYHLVGAASLDSALLGGYVSTVRKLHPEAPTPAVYRADSMLKDARKLRESIGDTAFAKLLPAPQNTLAADDEDSLDVIGAAEVSSWSSADLDLAFAAPARDPRRDQLVSALLDGPMSAYAEGARGDAAAFVPLENGLATVSKHAKSLGYDGIVLFLDELILWLQANMSDRVFVNSEISKLVKLIESSDPDRGVPIVSFISRQRDLSQLVGADVMGADVKNMEHQVEYLQERFTVVDLEDRNLPEIIKERVLKPRTGKEELLTEAFRTVDKTSQQVKDVLLDGQGATQADWTDFRAVYPLSPALLNVLVALSGALQRERTGLKLVQQLLEKNADAPLGSLIPLGDLWDVLVDGTGAAFTDRLKHEAEAARRFHAKVRGHLLEKYGSESSEKFIADDRFVKTLLLAALAPDVPALRRLTGARLAALNHGSVRSRTVQPGSMVVGRMRELQAEFPGEIRSDGELDPVFTLHLSDLDLEPLLEAVADEDKAGARRIWIREQLWTALGIKDTGFVSEREIVWRGTKRTAEFVYENVRDRSTLPDEQFSPAVTGNIRVVLDYPFDVPDKYPSDDFARVEELRAGGLAAPTLVWLPSFLSDQKKIQLGRLMRINFLLERDRLNDYAGHLTPEDRVRVRQQLEASRKTLTEQLTLALGQLYGVFDGPESTVSVAVTDGRHLLSLLPEFARPMPQGGKPFQDNLLHLADGMLSALHPKHPDLDPGKDRKAVTPGELKTALNWITRAVDDGGRITVDSHQLSTVKKIVEPLELGTVHDGPLVLRSDWRTRINQAADRRKAGDDLPVEDIRKWIDKDLGWSGLDRNVSSLIIAAYALLDDRAWLHHGSSRGPAPELGQIASGWSLRAQELPTEAEYLAARDRAARIFGISVPPALFARNVNKLAAAIAEAVTQYERPVTGLRRSLGKHAAALGLDGTPNARTASLRDGADLLARLGRHQDTLSRVRELAGATYPTTDQQLATAITASPEVLGALDDVNWRLLENVRGFVGRPDGVGDRAERLISRLRETAALGEFEKSLVPVLAEITDIGMGILNDAARLAQLVVPASPLPVTPVGPTSGTPAPTTSPEAEQPTADTVSLTQHGNPAVPSDQPSPVHTPSAQTPSVTHRRLVKPGLSGLEAVLAQEIDGLRDEIRDFSAANPGLTVEISWKVVPEQSPDASALPSDALGSGNGESS
ncbi:hypothetical protein QC334_25045 [Streptomyces sp. DH18]|uniref:hypothetical protein n=1 Tax=Streptomyces sp. DH18 TaxID=3040126 RepID=UPI0024435204|nr:hypothetical protein [Streptomyces sp. DH18]MDG9685960.1 hypothetical protein [Streptomyces sp. DH18]